MKIFLKNYRDFLIRNSTVGVCKTKNIFSLFKREGQNESFLWNKKQKKNLVIFFLISYKKTKNDLCRNFSIFYMVNKFFSLKKNNYNKKKIATQSLFLSKDKNEFR